MVQDIEYNPKDVAFVVYFRDNKSCGESEGQTLMRNVDELLKPTLYGSKFEVPSNTLESRSKLLLVSGLEEIMGENNQVYIKRFGMNDIPHRFLNHAELNNYFDYIKPDLFRLSRTQLMLALDSFKCSDTINYD